MNRRVFLRTTAMGAVLASAFPSSLLASEDEADPQFSFDLLTERMRARAAQPYESPAAELPEPFAVLGYDGHRAIRYRPERALWRGEAPFELQAFPMGWLFQEPVRLFTVEQDEARPVAFSGDDFEYRFPLDADNFRDVDLPGVAGFRLHYPLNRPDIMDEMVSFLGASYFRALGRGSIYGLSARGVAVNTATQGSEEFPRFDAFYIERPEAESHRVTIWATMDGGSLSGAFQFVISPGDETVMDVTARLFLREDVNRLGIAPLTSMFLFARNNRSAFRDYRNGVHDSDGLKIVRRSGEEIWRSLANPGRLATSFFSEDSPAAFGLFQRDREFANYQDAEARYERRPSLLIEPLDSWGRGTVALIEIPTDLEVNDNIVAFWIPEEEARAGQEFEFRYRMRWGDIDETRGNLARVHALRGGEGGVSGVEGNDGLQKFVVDFEGGALASFGADTEGLESVVRVSNAEIRHTALSRIDANGMWRLVIDVEAATDRPVELSAYLALSETRVSETWIYQWRPEDDRPR